MVKKGKITNPITLSDMDIIVPWKLGLGMSDGTFLKLEYIYGFEKFNTRPYHNYETWAGGWRVTDEKNGITFEEEYLEKAIEMWMRKAKEKNEPPND